MTHKCRIFLRPVLVGANIESGQERRDIMLAAQTKYALRALVFLSRQQGDGHYLSVHKVAELEEIPAPYLSKIFKRLASKDIVETKKGVGGGVRMSEQGRRASFFEVCLALEDPIVRPESFAFSLSSDRDSCPLHSAFLSAREDVVTFLKSTSLATLKFKEKAVDMLNGFDEMPYTNGNSAALE